MLQSSCFNFWNLEARLQYVVPICSQEWKLTCLEENYFVSQTCLKLLSFFAFYIWIKIKSYEYFCKMELCHNAHVLIKVVSLSLSKSLWPKRPGPINLPGKNVVKPIHLQYGWRSHSALWARWWHRLVHRPDQTHRPSWPLIPTQDLVHEVPALGLAPHVGPNPLTWELWYMRTVSHTADIPDWPGWELHSLDPGS